MKKKEKQNLVSLLIPKVEEIKLPKKKEKKVVDNNAPGLFSVAENEELCDRCVCAEDCPSNEVSPVFGCPYYTNKFRIDLSPVCLKCTKEGECEYQERYSGQVYTCYEFLFKPELKKAAPSKPLKSASSMLIGKSLKQAKKKEIKLNNLMQAALLKRKE